MDTYKGVLPSGVSFEVKEMGAREQGIITKQGDSENGENIIKLLKEVLVSIGDQGEEVTVDFIDSMLKNDRKVALIACRQFSLDFMEKFEFSYSWPIGDKGEKVESNHTVSFNDVTFPLVPYKWVRDKMEVYELEALQEGYDYKAEIPVLYNSYSEMLEENSKREFIDKSGRKFEYKMSDGHSERKLSKISESDLDINTPLSILSFNQLLTQTTGEKNKVVKLPYDVGNFGMIDISKLRDHVADYEGSYDTSLTIKHPNNDSKTTSVDLIGLKDFYFPRGLA